MSQQLWTDVDRYITGHLVPADHALDAAVDACEAADLPQMAVSPNEGKLLHVLARSCGARRILEIGTLGGFSTIWLGRALPSDGRLISLELDERHASVARENVARAGLERVVDIRVGRALDLLPKLAAENPGPFDFIFIDADKESNADYFAWALKLSRPGSVIVVDNVVRAGGVVDASHTDSRILGVRRLYEAMAAEPRVTATAIQTVGSKGHDGFAIAIVNG